MLSHYIVYGYSLVVILVHIHLVRQFLLVRGDLKCLTLTLTAFLQSWRGINRLPVFSRQNFIGGHGDYARENTVNELRNRRSHIIKIIIFIYLVVIVMFAYENIFGYGLDNPPTHDISDYGMWPPGKLYVWWIETRLYFWRINIRIYIYWDFL